MNKGRLIVVVGGQFGSEAKGHVTAQLAARAEPNSLVIRTGGPNAGHTVWRADHEYKLRHLPTPIAVRDDITASLAARSVVDPRVLRDEMKLFPNRAVVVDPAATILEIDHIEHETHSAQMVGIGSTRKGIGAARADRIERQARTARDLWGERGTEIDPGIVCTDVADLARQTLDLGADVIVEAAQGYGLGLHTAYYPYVTSADCTALDALADARLSPWALGVTPEVWMVMRPFPIRVAGTSGPLYGETSWAALNLPEERTTVTNKVRRVGAWDPELAHRAAIANGVDGGAVRVALMMADQLIPAAAGMQDPDLFLETFSDHPGMNELIGRVAGDTGCPVAAIGTGPASMVFARDLGMAGL